MDGSHMGESHKEESHKKESLKGDKAALRRHAAEICGEADFPDYRRESSRKITEHITGSSLYSDCCAVFIFVSDRREPDTRELIGAALESGKKVYVPLCTGDGIMEAVRISSLSELHPGKYGILEPVKDEYTEIRDPEDFGTDDICAVPCVMASEEGARLGHGGGYYDRFLERTEARKVCLCFVRLLTDGIPEEDHDIRMDCIVTEEGIKII